MLPSTWMCVVVVQFRHIRPIFVAANRISVWLPSVLFILSKVSIWKKKNAKRGNKNHCVGTTSKWMTVTIPSIQARTSIVHAVYIHMHSPSLDCYYPAVNSYSSITFPFSFFTTINIQLTAFSTQQQEKQKKTQCSTSIQCEKQTSKSNISTVYDWPSLRRRRRQQYIYKKNSEIRSNILAWNRSCAH